MSARGNMVLTDRAATPVAHTFTPDGDDANGVHIYSEKGSVPAGNSRVTTSLTESKGKYRPVLKLSVPVVATQTINGVSSPVVLRTHYAEVRFTFDALSTTQERKDVVGMTAGMLLPANAQVDDMVVNLTDTW